ncbi:MAG: flagellar basal body L-ring protein FlgH [Acidobacteria bacterium]|nr:flagellar basal body L-ring protein FlgH [Acidobacteriota bacterium]
MKLRSLFLFCVVCGGRLLAQSAPGSTFSESGRYSDLATDFRARRVGDVITIQVSDRLSATSQGTSASSRKSSANSNITRLLGQPSALGALSNLAALTGESKLDGSGATNRSNVLTTTLSGRVVEVLPNGDLVIQATKQVGVNAEKHQISIQGVVRWNDISANNQIRSDRIGMMQIQLDGKWLVSDAIRRPNLLYRILLGILPF